MKAASRFIQNGSILDLGCGEGNLLNYNKNIYTTYFGIDCDEECIKVARGKFPSPDNRFIHAKIDDISLIKKFDNIVMLAFIEHVDNPVEVLKFLKNSLTEKGKIIITTPGPTAEFIHKIGSRFGLFDKEAGEEHKKIFDEKDLRQLAQDAGLKIIYYKTFEFGLNHLVVMKNG